MSESAPVAQPTRKPPPSGESKPAAPKKKAASKKRPAAAPAAKKTESAKPRRASKRKRTYVYGAIKDGAEVLSKPFNNEADMIDDLAVSLAPDTVVTLYRSYKQGSLRMTAKVK